MSIEDVHRAMASLTVAASGTVEDYADTRVRGYLKEHPDIVEHRLDLLALMVDQVRAVVTHERAADKWPTLTGCDPHDEHGKWVDEYQAHTCTCGHCFNGNSNIADLIKTVCGQALRVAQEQQNKELYPLLYDMHHVLNGDDDPEMRYTPNPDMQYVPPTEVRVFHCADGWVITSPPEREACTSNHDREQNGMPPCTDTAVWKVVEHNDYGLSIGIYCDADLPAEHRQPADA